MFDTHRFCARINTKLYQNFSKSFNSDKASKSSLLPLLLLKNASNKDFEKYYETNTYIYDFKAIGTVIQQLIDDLYEPTFKKMPYSNLKNLQQVLMDTVRFKDIKYYY